MKIAVKCKICSKMENVSQTRAASYATCSHNCLSKLIESKKSLNCTCTNCNKQFHMKESQIKRYNRNMGLFCSMKCNTNYKKDYYKGKNNPNFRGRQYDDDGYRINHYPLVGRIKEHLFVTLQYLKINKIPKGHVIHHKDCNIYNNTPENLVIITISEHKWLHKQFGNATLWAYTQGKVDLETLVSWSNDPIRTTKLLPLNLIKQIGVFKQDELLETPEKDNQQPSISSNTFEGSTTNSRILTSNVEDSNANTSVLLGYTKTETKIIGIQCTLKDGSKIFVKANDDIV